MRKGNEVNEFKNFFIINSIIYENLFFEKTVWKFFLKIFYNNC